MRGMVVQCLIRLLEHIREVSESLRGVERKWRR